MVTIKTILFPTDFSLRALHGYCYCLQLAKKLGASVHVLHVYSIDIGVPVTDAIAYKMVDERKKILNICWGILLTSRKHNKHH